MECNFPAVFSAKYRKVNTRTGFCEQPGLCAMFVSMRSGAWRLAPCLAVIT